MTDARVRLRRHLRAARSRIPSSRRRQAARAAARRLTRDPVFRRSRVVALYAASGSEISAWPLLAHSLARRKRVLLPVVRGTRLHFAAWDGGRRLRAARFGILEPPPGAVRAWRSRIDLVVAPLLGFDLDCNRLGQGGGYYDRAFAGHALPRWHHTRLFGIAFEAQRCPALATQPWDVPLDGVFTEARRYRRRQTS